MRDGSPWFLFVLCVLATWRLAHLVAREDGPFDVVLRLRARAGDGMLGRLMDCPYCLSVWIAAPLALLLSTKPLEWCLAWWAISGGSSLLERATAPPPPPANLPVPNLPSHGDEDDVLLRPTTRLDDDAERAPSHDDDDKPGAGSAGPTPFARGA